MTRRALKKQALSFRDRAESFLALARELETRKFSDARQKMIREVLLHDAKKLTAVVQKIMRKSDDIRTWAHDVFGDDVDNSGVAKFASKIMANSINAALGFQSYRIRKFLRSGEFERAPNSTGTLVASGIANLLSELTQ